MAYKNFFVIYILLLGTYLVTYNVYYTSIRLPYFDGSHHFSELMNYALAMRSNFFQSLYSMWSTSPELFAQYTLIGTLSNLLFYDRSIFLVIYLILLVWLFWKVYCYSNKNIQQGLMLYVLLIASTILLSSKGGVLDTRIDVIAIVFFGFAILEIFNKNIINTLLFIIIAMFLKSSILFLAVPFFIYISYQIIINFKDYKKSEYIKLGLSISLLFVYLYKILLKSIAYNLMSTGGENAESSLLIYFEKLYQYIFHDFYFYGKFLIQDITFIIVIVLLFIKLLLRDTLKNDKKIILSFFLFFIWTYLLLTSNPVHERVLLIWFYPTYFFGVLIVFKLIDKNRFTHIFIISLLFFQTFLIVIQNRYPNEWKKDYYIKATKDIKNQSVQIVQYLNKNSQSDSILILVNFLSNHGPVSYNYDVYRVLLHEKLKIKKEIIGWELSTYGADWRKEVSKYLKSKQNIIFILQENPMGIPQENNPQKYGQSNYNELLNFKEKNFECMVQIADKVSLPHIGDRIVYEFQNTNNCIEKLKLK
jgi:hypothetical protein